MEKRKIQFSPPDISEMEIAEVAEAMRSGWITTGPRTLLLERRLSTFITTGRNDVVGNANRVVCLNSATAAEEMNLRLLGVGPGDEVIVPAYTYSATASAAIHCGARVIFADIQRNGSSDTHMPEMDYERVKDLINERTKAVIPVDLGGIVCDYDRLFEVVEATRSRFVPKKPDGTPLGDLSSRIQSAIGRVPIVADSAHSLGASRVAAGKRRYCGDIADFTSFSFHAVKSFTTAEGGASAWKSIPGIDDSEIYRMTQLLSLHGQSKDARLKTKAGDWEYDIIAPWFKCNMTDITAGIGLRQLDRYPALLERRHEIVRKYDKVCDALGVSRLVHATPTMTSSFHLYLIRIPGFGEEKRNLLIKQMAERGVATNVHYKPLPMMTAYKALGWDIKDFPNSYDYYYNLVTLPLHTKLSDEDVEYVCAALEDAIRQC